MKPKSGPRWSSSPAQGRIEPGKSRPNIPYLPFRGTASPVAALGQGPPSRLRPHHDRFTPDSCRLGAPPKSAGSGQIRTFKAEQILVTDVVDAVDESVEVPGPLRVALTECHALFGQLPLRVLVLDQVRQTHAAEDVGGFGELDIVIADDLNAVAPWVAEIEEWALERGNAGSLEGGACRLLVVDHQAEMATIVCSLFAAFLKSNELVAQIDKGHGVTLAAQLELEEAAVERQCLLDVSHL